MIRKTQFILIGIILALIVVTLVGLLVRQVMADGTDEEELLADNSSIFESVSNLEALNLGLIDGEQLREENGISSDGSSSSAVIQKDVTVSISLRSIQDDLKIKLSDISSGNLIYNVNFTVTVKGKDTTTTYNDTDKDGIIYLPYVTAGDYTVFMSDISSDGVNYHCDKSQTITVTDSIKYAKVDIKDEIKTEAQINVAEEDTKVQDVDETTDVSSTSEAEEPAPVEEEQIFDEGISEDAEDLLAQIEAENDAQEKEKAIAGASSGTVSAPTPSPADSQSPDVPDITSDPTYIAAHEGSKGVDVSKHNGNIDWGAVKNSGIDFAIIRCGYRGSSSGALIVDPLFYQNIIAAQGAGLSVGVYFFSQAVNEAEAVEEASMVLELINGYSLQMPVYIDVEKSNGRGDAISVEERNATIAAFLATISNAGYSAGLYSNKLWLENRISAGAFTNYKIWLAQYVDIPTYTATRYDIWQYTSKGSIPGIAGNVDMNVLK
ncbi:MAG: glycoside hydrolase family 25 protein [Butyrivibrio sp.]|nr:glycoside hydrolase family 25 protein [Butyrivibrio sp.]